MFEACSVVVAIGAAYKRTDNVDLGSRNGTVYSPTHVTCHTKDVLYMYMLLQRVRNMNLKLQRAGFNKTYVFCIASPQRLSTL